MMDREIYSMQDAVAQTWRSKEMRQERKEAKNAKNATRDELCALCSFAHLARARVVPWCFPFVAILALATTPTWAVDFARESIPRKWVEPLVPEDLPALVYPKYFSDFDKAKAQAFAGRYKLALQTLEAVKDAPPVDVALVKAQALVGLGKFSDALAVLSDPAVADQPKVQIARAIDLDEMGQTSQAIDLLKAHLTAHPDSLQGHYQLGRISETLGDLETAKSAYAWFVQAPQSYLDKWRGQGEKLFDNADDAVTLGRALDRWATLNGQCQTDASLNDTILDIFVKSYDVIDRQYWPAHVAAGEFFLSHDNSNDARKELLAALHGNPNDANANRLLGEISESQFDFDTCDQIVDYMRRCNPDSTDADLLEVRNLLRQRRPKEAGQLARSVLDKRPNLLEAMGLLAASEALQLHDQQTKALLADVDKVNPHDATAYFEVAEQLGAMRQYPRAAAMYKIAVDRAPWWTAPRNGMGLLYTQSGDEDLARSTLDAAHQLDPYNVQTTNYLRLLDQLSAFSVKESAHFIVMYDGKLDPLIPFYFNDYLESVYPAVTGEYHTDPPVKTIIEVFPTHDAFSVRTTGSPWIGTVGASTGRVIAMVAPRKGENTQGAFNWSQVLRHEFTHTVTLAATDNRISHWMTEGLAVMEERSPLQWTWVPMLYHAVTKNELFDMDSLTWAFIRPRRPSDRQLAYAESFWVCTYIQQTYGHDAILKMLAEFKAGGLQDDVFPKVLGRSTTQFFSEFFAWAGQQVAGWGYDADSQKKYDDLKAQGDELIKSKQYPDAVVVWEQIAALRPVDELPHTRLAGLYLSKAVNQPDKSIAHLKILHQVDLKDDRYAKRIARIYRDEGKLPDAEHWGLQAIYIDPYDMDAHELLSQLAEKAGDEPALQREQQVIPILKTWQEQMKKAAEIPAQ
jgi:cellulose synthase operon protein C